MIKVDARAATGQDQTLFGFFCRNLPVETVTQVGGDHPKKTETKVVVPPPRNTRSAFASAFSLPVWQDEYQKK
ncbi:MAG: hypothetical protein AAB542_04365 [Patescibacteria group bacterium]